MEIFWRFASDDGTATATTTADGYDVVNLQRPTLSPGWKSTATASQVLTFDLGSAQAISGFALLGHDLVAGTDTATLQAASDSGFTTDVVNFTVNLTDTNWYQFFGSQTRQYWRTTLNKTSGGSSISAGRMVLGPTYTPTHGLRPSYRQGPSVDTSSNVRTRGGQRYSSIGETLRSLSGVMPGLNDTDYDEIALLESTYGTHTPFIISVDFASAPTRKTLYGHLTSLTPFANVARTLWEWNFNMVEQK
jgi:hypothetical protein